MKFSDNVGNIYSSLFTLMVETIQQYNRKYKKRINTLINLTNTKLANEQTFKFSWRSGSLSGYRDCFPNSSSRTDSPDGGTDIETLVRRYLAEVCTVPVHLVFPVFILCVLRVRFL